MSTHRIFFDLLQKVGTQGKYQNTLLIFWSICFLACGASTYFNAFLFFQDNYRCSFGSEDCMKYVCSLPETERMNFIGARDHSFLSKFGDFRCESDMQVKQTLSFIYLGGLVGVLLGSILNQYITKWRLLLLTVFLNIIGIIIAIFADSLFLASVGLFINYAAKSVQAEVIPCIITETVSQEKRGKHVMTAYLFYGLGVTLNGAVFKLIDNWRVLLLIYQLLPFVIFLFGILYFIEETPFDSIVNYSSEQSLLMLQRIAIRNDKLDHGLSLESISQIKNSYEQNQNAKHRSVITVVDLFRYNSLRTIAIISIVLHFLISYQFNVPQLIIEDYALDIYLAGIILGSSQLLASIVCYYVVNDCQRKRIIFIVQVMGILASAPIFFFASCGQSVEECGVFSSIIQIVGIFFFRFFVTIGYNIFYMAQYEMFPTQIRSLATQFTSAISVLAIMISPMVQTYFNSIGISMIATFSISCVMILLGIIKMPQTYYVPPPEIIEELHADNQTCLEDILKHQANISTPPQTSN